jgi:hypothetical protein
MAEIETVLEQKLDELIILQKKEIKLLEQLTEDRCTCKKHHHKKEKKRKEK